MALLGKTLAVVSLGISCQTTFQLERAKARISAAHGEDLVELSMPFDWRIVGPVDVAGMLKDAEFYPEDQTELTGERRRYWKRRRCWFWHDKWDDFGRFRAKQAHLVDNWRKIPETRRQVFIASNTQNNLPQKREEVGGFDVRVRLEDLFALQARLEVLFPAPELHFVTRAPLMVDLQAFGFQGIREREHWVKVASMARDGVHLHQVGLDRSQWSGDNGAWDSILDRIMARGAPAKLKATK